MSLEAGGPQSGARLHFSIRGRKVNPSPHASFPRVFTSITRTLLEEADEAGVYKCRPEMRAVWVRAASYLQPPCDSPNPVGFLALLFREFSFVKNSKLFISETLDSSVTLRVF